MRLTALTNVADDSRTMLCDGLTTRRANAASSHQGLIGHRGAAVRFLPHPCFLGNAGPARGIGMLCVLCASVSSVFKEHLAGACCMASRCAAGRLRLTQSIQAALPGARRSAGNTLG